MGLCTCFPTDVKPLLRLVRFQILDGVYPQFQISNSVNYLQSCRNMICLKDVIHSVMLTPFSAYMQGIGIEFLSSSTFPKYWRYCQGCCIPCYSLFDARLQKDSTFRVYLAERGDCVRYLKNTKSNSAFITFELGWF